MTAGQLSEHDRNFKTLVIILNLSKITLLLTHKTGVTGLSYHQEETGVQQCQECSKINNITFIFLSFPQVGMNREQVPAEETASANTVQPGCRRSGLFQM